MLNKVIGDPNITPHSTLKWRNKHGQGAKEERLWKKIWWGHSVWPRLWKIANNRTMYLYCSSGKLMTKTYRVLTLLLLSCSIAAAALLFTVGLAHDHLGPERKWTYPLFFVLIPAFVLQTGIRYVFHKKPHANQSDQWLNKLRIALKKTDTKPKHGDPQ